VPSRIARAGLTQALDRRKIMAEAEIQLSLTTLTLLRFGQYLLMAGLAIVFSNLFFLSTPELASGLRTWGGIAIALGALVRLTGLISGSRDRSRAV